MTVIVDSKKVKKIADFLTDDPDIFNEMAVSTGGIAMGPAGNMPVPKKSKPKSRKRRKKVALDDSTSEPISKFHANPVTGKPDEGEVLYSDTQSEDTDETVD